jgi:hypothetical protein
VPINKSKIPNPMAMGVTSFLFLDTETIGFDIICAGTMTVSVFWVGSVSTFACVYGSGVGSTGEMGDGMTDKFSNVGSAGGRR